MIINDCEELKLPNSELLCRSRFANIYTDGKTVLKEYYKDVSMFLRIYQETFEKLSDVNSPAFIKLRDCYTADIPDYVLYADDDEKFVIGYTYDYITEVGTDMIDMPMEYTLNTIHEFDLLVKELNKRRILLDDPNNGNSLITKDNLVIIDPDLFELDQDSKMLRKNYEIANRYIMNKWAREYPLIEEYEVNELFRQYFKDYDDDFNDNYYQSMKRRLKEKTPNDLLYKVFGEKI